MTMSTYDNGPELDGWQLPPRCCGDWCEGLTCNTCGRWRHDIPPNIELGSE